MYIPPSSVFESIIHIMCKKVNTCNQQSPNIYLTEKARSYEKLAESIQEKYIHAAGDLLDGQRQREIEDTVSFMVSLIRRINQNLEEG